MQITIKRKVGKSFVPVDIPEGISISALKSWIGKPCVLEAKDGNDKTYAYGNEEVRGAWENGKHVVSMDIFCFNYQYGFNAFARQEARAERRAICESDNVSEETIQAIYKDYPLIYGPESPITTPQETRTA